LKEENMSSPTRESLLEAEQSYVNALLGGDPGAVQKQLDANFQITSATSRAVSGNDLVQSLKSGALKYRSLKHTVLDAKVVGNIGVIAGNAEATIDIGGTSHTARTPYLCNWAHAGNNWTLVSSHTGDVAEVGIDKAAAIDRQAGRGVLTAQRAYASALQSNKTDALQKAVHANYSSLTHDGKAIAKDAFIGSIQRGDLKYEKFDYQIDSVSVKGNVATITGRSWGSGTLNGAGFSGGAGFACVWINVDTGDPAPDRVAGWQLLSTQVSNVVQAETQVAAAGA
jgi:hypothetical protein